MLIYAAFFCYLGIGPVHGLTTDGSYCQIQDGPFASRVQCERAIEMQGGPMTKRGDGSTQGLRCLAAR